MRILLENAGNYILMAIIQGFTEVFPVSSSGHIVIYSHILGMQITFAYVIFLHIGTFLAILVNYRRQVWNILGGKAGWKLPALLFVSFAMTALVGLIFQNLAAHITSEQPSDVAVLWVVNGIILCAIGFFSPQGTKRIDQLGIWSFLTIGIVQGMTTLPGISRLGLTLGIGLFLGLKWFEALDLSLLLSLPTVFFANMFVLVQQLHPEWLAWSLQSASDNTSAVIINSASANWLFGALTVLLSFLSCLVAIRVLSKFLGRKLLVYFGVYCLSAGVFFFFFLNL